MSKKKPSIECKEHQVTQHVLTSVKHDRFWVTQSRDGKHDDFDVQIRLDGDRVYLGTGGISYDSRISCDVSLEEFYDLIRSHITTVKAPKASYARP